MESAMNVCQSEKIPNFTLVLISQDTKMTRLTRYYYYRGNHNINVMIITNHFFVKSKTHSK